ncbi:pol polyprotein [Vairimorpha apis BRL 01]|uniref:Pol polyprotein n=1 Tax=Vairimorpha apis BRL 01 TaxID=1037528 RepID=T0MF37_9MICR|nr:pol polyprotein [Vairimorpha apis BRL 01]
MLIIKKLDKIYQTNFSKISEYLQELETTLKIYATITKIPKTEVARKLNELFIKNLGRATKLHLIQNEKDENYDTVYKYLLKLEKRLMNLALEEEISKISITTLNVENSKKYRTKFKNIKTERSKTNNLKSDKHKKESRSVFSKGEEEFTKKHTKEKYNAIIQEPVNKVDAIYCFFKFKNDKIKILIDSGSTRNIISKEFVKNYKLKEKEDEEISLTLGNSDTMKLNKTVTLGLTPTNSDKIFKIKFFVANKTPEALVFGNDFHTAFDSIINYKNWTLEAGGIIMEIHRDGTKNIDNNEVDKMFFDKFNTALERKKNNKNSDKQIRKYKQKHKHIEGNENVMADKISRSLTMKKSVKDKSKKYLQNLNKKHRTKINCINGKSFLPMKQSNKYKTPKTLSKDKGIEYDKKIVKVRTERQEVKQFF